MNMHARNLLLAALASGAIACGSGGGTSSTGTTNATSSSSGGGHGGSAGHGGSPGGSAGMGGSPAVNECQDGTAVCDPNADCVDTPGFYQCVCKPGYQGDGKTCADVDECQSLLADCDPNAACTNTAGGYTCACPNGFTGDGKSCHATYSAIAAGQFHACAVRADKTMWCWGHNTSGQAGTGTADPLFLRPAPAGNGTDWQAVGAGASFTCALDGSHLISCWGTNGSGQLGDGTTTGKSSPTPVTGGIADWASLDVGNNHVCAIRADGSLYCWGANARGQIGDGTNNNATAPTLVSAGPWLSVTSGSEFSCAVKADHTLWCWGLDTTRQLGDGKTTNSNVPVQEATLATNWASVTAGTTYACGLKQDGTRWCWGGNTAGQGGNTLSANIVQPTQVDTATDWKLLDAGELAACGIKADGGLYCWGDGSLGQTAQPGNEAPLLTPTAVGADKDWKALASGLRFACGLKDDGRVHCWGSATRAAIGLGWAADRSDPTLVGADTDWVEVATQLDNGCGIRGTGDLYCWGRNVSSNLGDGTNITRPTPVQIGAGKTWQHVALGRSHSCGIASDGIHCWGADGNGEQGNGTGATAQTQPAPIHAVANLPTAWTAIAAGLNHTCAVGQDQTLWCWGRNNAGQVGDSTTTNRSDPTLVPSGGAAWVDVAAGGDYTCALRAGGALYCWGANGSGQIGTGDTTSPVAAPTAIGAGNWAAIAAGQSHTCAVDKNGKLFCWGLASSGQIGLGNTAGPVLVPTQVGTDTDWLRPRVGQGPSTCAIKVNGDMWCWGSGSYGQLGIGTLANSSAPKKVPSLSPWKTAALGNEHTCGVAMDGRLSCWGASYGAQLASGVPFVSTPAALLEP